MIEKHNKTVSNSIESNETTTKNGTTSIITNSSEVTGDNYELLNSNTLINIEMSSSN
mgnify:CR=1 FL=1